VKPGVQFHIRDDNQGAELAIGPGKVSLLEGIAQTGSITSAARKLGMSYRRAWLLVDETTSCLIEAAMRTAIGGKRGGGTVLTAVGAKLVRRYRALECQAEAAVTGKLKSSLRMLPPAAKAPCEGRYDSTIGRGSRGTERKLKEMNWPDRRLFASIFQS
jgi:molybdate transport system regulatory protein